ncbi:ATP-binding cassette domain-containing protein [Brevibacterium sp. LE-L]|uniref:ATP-binding cassette domain-containing protein n=1 Tax=Brevibacterium sp. LE-L TaxID=3418557 RepID=UPI003CF3C14D
MRHAAPEEIYRRVAFVFQDNVLLRMSVRDNLRLAAPDADDATVEAAARAAQIHDVIMSMPHGYDTIVHEQVTPSGGETQRLCIARAMLADAPIVVLDEATAFADPESEAAVQDALSTLIAGRAVLVIAHRLRTITDADQIVVLEGGRVVETGRHDELLDHGRLYAALWNAQEGTTA